MNVYKLIVLLASFALSTPCLAISSKAKVISALDEIAAQSGLVRVEKKGIDLVYRRPDATLSKYVKVMLHPVDVQFSKNFDPGRQSMLYKMNPPDRERIKTELAEEFAKVFRRELQDGGYQVMNERGPDVLEVRAAIANLYINAPDISMQTSSNVKVYTTDAGEMTLVMELRDSATGAILAQVYDRRRGTTGGNAWTWSTSISNSVEARQIIGAWASALRKAFDASR